MATTAPYAKSIDQFRGKFAEMARPNLFQVSIYLPKTQLAPLQPVNDAVVASTQDNEGQGTTSLDELTQFMVKAASFPASTIGVVEVPFRGRQLKIAGDRTYEPWSVTVLNDEGFTIRQQMETWAQTIQEYKINGSSAQNTGEYMGRAIVDQLSRDGEIIKQATLEGIWPSNISALDLDWGTNDTPEEYTVEFQVQYWLPIKGEETSTTNTPPTS
jgi:hypothetical protein|tara:strand:- start:1788 stop:2432 length:645 start_codon:yes stop_codon:yes gene_type:complete